LGQGLALWGEPASAVFVRRDDNAQGSNEQQDDAGDGGEASRLR
jgi:hypothetical protein